uniref:Ubiquitin-40S ribosomal protein S27a-like n=1 Tax=Labrus bergylta TaxID=56723 RepID=A0A3Q3H1Z8_9LABR
NVAIYQGERWFFHLCDTEEQLKSITVLQLKQKIAEKIDDPLARGRPDGFRLTFKDEVLVDNKLLSDYGIVNMSVVMVILRLVGGGGGGPHTWKGDDAMGDKDKNRSMEKLASF